MAGFHHDHTAAGEHVADLVLSLMLISVVAGARSNPEQPDGITDLGFPMIIAGLEVHQLTC